MKRELKIIGRNLRRYRNEKKITQEKLSELAEVHVSIIGNLETGTKSVTLGTLKKLSDALNIDFFQLFGFSDDYVGLTQDQIDAVKKIIEQFKKTNK